MHIINRTRVKYGETQNEAELQEVMQSAREQLKWHEEHDHPARKHYIVVEYDHETGWWVILIEWRYKYPTYADEVFQNQDEHQLATLHRASQQHAQKSATGM